MNIQQAALVAKHRNHAGFENMVLETLRNGDLFMTKMEASIKVAEYLEKEANNAK